MTVLVTGGSGFIGSYTLRRLVEMGEKAISFSRKPPPEDIAGKVSVETDHRGDVRFLTSILSAIKKHDVKSIIHTASMLAYASQKDPALGFDINARGTLNILEAARIMNIKRVVYVSGQSVYGITEEGKWVTEDHPRNPLKIYPAIKVLCENLGLSYIENYGLDWVAIRFPLVYGPGKSRRGYHSYKDCIEDAVFKRYVRIPRGGDQKFGCIYVKDAANGLVLAAFARKMKHRIFNIGPGISEMYTLRDLSSILKKLIPDAVFEIGPGVLTELEFIRGPLDITRAREELNYEPQYPRLEDGVKEYIEILRRQV